MPLTPEHGAEIRRRIAVVPESPGLYLRLSVAENLRCFADLYEVPEATDRIGRALRAVSLADRANQACGSLSKGLRQRVALARALLSDPRVLFLDEPTAGLDPVAAREVHELIDEPLPSRGETAAATTLGGTPPTHAAIRTTDRRLDGVRRRAIPDVLQPIAAAVAGLGDRFRPPCSAPGL